MTNYLWRWRVVATRLAVAMICILVAAPQAALAGTTGTITGTVSDAASGAPIANAVVSASSGSSTQTTKSNAAGFYSLQQVIPDTYTVSFQAQGYEPNSTPGVTVQQDLTFKLDIKLNKTLKTIANVTSRSPGNLVKPYEGTDVYNVSGAQLNASTGGDNLHRTVYEYLDTVPGVTPIGGAYPAEPSIRGGYDVDNGYELDGIPITERVTGFFTTNLTDLGIQNVEVYTGGLSAQNAGNGMGIINSVIKSGSYPGFRTLSLGVVGPDYNHYLRAELGGATPDKRYSWYFGFDAANSQNIYWSNGARPDIPITQLGISLSNPAYIYTRDFIANLHYKPDQKNDIQFFYQNGVYDGLSNYGITNSGAFGLAPCPGAVSAPTSSNATGGIAPNGQTCPLGLYLTGLAPGQGDRTGHYSGIGKIQLNHIINDHSSFSLRLAENFNQYIFDQIYSDPNSPVNNAVGGGTNISSTCPPYPYSLGGPLPSDTGDSTGAECTYDLGDYWQSRRGHNYFAQLDYSAIPSENASYKVGVGQEYDYEIRDVRYLNLFDFPGRTRHTCRGWAFSYPCHNAFTDIPTHVPYYYAQGSFNVGRFTFQPGIRYSMIYYGIPQEFGGGKSVGFLAPSILGTYRMNASNAFRFSYAESGQFIGTEFVYRLHNTTYNPAKNTEQSYQPQINHVTDFQWEHQFNADTSLKIGPYYRATNNYLGIFTPIVTISPPKYGDQELKSGLKIRSFGAEIGLSHLDRHDTGLSYWLSGAYNNYWTQVSAYTGGQTSFINFPLPDDLLSKGIYVRGYQVPLFSGTLTLDAHTHGWHFLPVVYYSEGNFYNTGACNDPTINPPFLNDCQSAALDTGVPSVLAPEGIGNGYWYVNATLEKELNPHYMVGIRVSNLTNNQHGTTPCWNPNSTNPALTTGMGTGCPPFNGSGSQYTAPVGWVYQPVTQDPRRIEGFVNIKF